MSEDARVQVRVDLPNHPLTESETLWARPLEDGRFEVRNVPFYAYGLNFLDLVKAREDGEGPWRITRISEPSGHRTIRLFLTEPLAPAQRGMFLLQLRGLGVALDEATDQYIAVDVPPESDWEAVRAHLDGLEKEGTLSYETAEAREKGSFDDRYRGD